MTILRQELVPLLLCVLLAATVQAHARKWTNATGKFSVEADLVEAKEGKIQLRREDGKVITVPIDKLSEADQRYLAELAKPRNQPVGVPSPEVDPPPNKAAMEKPAADPSAGGNPTLHAALLGEENRKAASEKIKEIGYGYLEYYNPPQDKLPGGTHTSRELQHNWEIAILKVMEEDELLKQLQASKALLQPWDGPEGEKLLKKMPEFLLSPGAKNEGLTRFRTFSGPGTPFNDEKPFNARDITDGGTIFAIEVGPEKAVPWTQPGGIPIDSKDLVAELGSPREDGYLAVTFESMIVLINKNIDNETLRALVTHRGGEVVDEEKWKVPDRVEQERLLAAEEKAAKEKAAWKTLLAKDPAARRFKSVQNLKQIMLAMLNRQLAFKRFPSEINTNQKVVDNWEVQIMPFLDEHQFYDKLGQEKILEKPWDGPEGKTLLDRMPEVYLAPGTENQGLTRYRIFSGAGTMFADEKGITFSGIRDGASTTIAVIEVGPEKAVPWTQPGGIAIDSADLLAELGEPREGGYLAAMADGRVITLKADIDEKTLRALISPAGSEVVAEADYLAK